MKAYILKLSFEDITPLIWRRIILPAGATFNRLHETIQNVTNFQSTLDRHTIPLEWRLMIILLQTMNRL